MMCKLMTMSHKDAKAELSNFKYIGVCDYYIKNIIYNLILNRETN